MPVEVRAQNETEKLSGKYYKFGEKSKYEISSLPPSTSITPLGTLNVSRN